MNIQSSFLSQQLNDALGYISLFPENIRTLSLNQESIVAQYDDVIDQPEFKEHIDHLSSYCRVTFIGYRRIHLSTR